MIATKDNFWDWVDTLHPEEFMQIITNLTGDRKLLMERNCTESHIEAQFKTYLERECNQCDRFNGCGEYFTDYDDLNEDDLCSECAYQETTQEKVRTEIQEEK